MKEAMLADAAGEQRKIAAVYVAAIITGAVASKKAAVDQNMDEPGLPRGKAGPDAPVGC